MTSEEFNWDIFLTDCVWNKEDGFKFLMQEENRMRYSTFEFHYS